MKDWVRYLCMGVLVAWLTGCNQGVFIDDFRSEVEQVQLESDEDEVTLRFQTDEYLCMGVLVAWLTGCNQGVFIDDFRSEVEQVQLESDEDEVTLRFQTDDWTVKGGELSHSLTGQFSPFFFQQYNEQGEHIGTQESPSLDRHGRTDDWTVKGGELSHSLTGQFSPFFFQQYNEQGEHIGTQESPSLDRHGSLLLRHPLIELSIEHLHSGELTVRVVENLLPDCTLFLILADKEIPEIQQFIRIQLQTAKYELEDITYTLDIWGGDREDDDRVLQSVTNNTDTPVTLVLYPWKEERKHLGRRSRR